jgi:hypothetical protein
MRCFPGAQASNLTISNAKRNADAAAPSSGHADDLVSYYHRRAGAANKGDALRQARIRMIDELTARDFKGRSAYAYSRPIFWSPWVIVSGNGNSKPGSEAID